MEKRRKDKSGQEPKIFKKKSKISLGGCHSPARLHHKEKETLEETKESFTVKPAARKSVSSGKRQKENLVKVSSVAAIHPKSAFNTRYLTEALPSKPGKDRQKKLFKSSIISPERVTFHDSFARSTKDRLSLNDPRKLKNPESATKGASTAC